MKNGKERLTKHKKRDGLTDEGKAIKGGDCQKGRGRNEENKGKKINQVGIKRTLVDKKKGGRNKTTPLCATAFLIQCCCHQF